MVLQTSGRLRRCVVLASSALVCAAGTALGQVVVDFESFNGSSAGTPLTTGFGGGGQGGWYNPVAGSIDFNVYTYAGNAMNFPANPAGGQQFIAVAGQVSPNNIGRGQLAVDFSAGGLWTAEWDVIGAYHGISGTAIDNLGSFSLQNSATANYFQQIMQWGLNTTAPVQYDINYGIFPAAGGAAPAFMSPGAAWTNIPVNHWVRQKTTWDFTSNQILSVSIENLTLGTPPVVADVSGMGWFLAGGQNNVLAKPMPTDIRTFTGNTDNATGWDNIRVGPAAAPCYANCDGSTVTPVLNVDDFTCFINAYAVAQTLPHSQQLTDYANCDNSTTPPVLNVDDFTCFINAYAIGCP
jgi:hypothetical protein